jgi:hypothetical protein
VVKYRLSFTVGAETIFELISRVMPIQDLEVEELSSNEQPVRQVAHLKRKKRIPQLNLKKGANRILLEVFSDGKPHRSKEVKAPLEAAGYSIQGVHSHLNRLRRHDVVYQPEAGWWQLRRKLDALVGAANGGHNAP